MIDRVVFLQPRTLASRNYMNSASGEQTWTPWSALVLAPSAQRSGLRAELVDARTDPGWLGILETLGESDLLAVSVMTGKSIVDALTATGIAKAQGAKVIWGGPHVSLFPTETLSEAQVDAVIPGFGSAAFSRLCEVLGSGSWPFAQPEVLRAVTHVTLDRAGRAQAACSAPAFDLIPNWALYTNPDVAIADRTVNLITSEGCSRRCTYCSEPKTSENTWLTYGVHETVALAVELNARAGANGFKLHDPNFFHDFDRAASFAQQFSSKVGLPWAATMHPADLARITEPQLAELAQMGLRRLLVGLESPDPEIVRLAGKQYDPALIPTLVQKLARVGVRGMFTFIVGWPGADPGHYARTITCARSVRQAWSEHQAKIHFLEPWPGTPIFKLVLRLGFIAPSTLSEWADIDYYQARYTTIHDREQMSILREVNRELSPYVDA